MRNAVLLCAIDLAIFIGGVACTTQRDEPKLVGQDVRVTVIHTADIHSRLFPYRFVPNRTDQDFGLLPEEAPFGGIGRIGYIVKDQRAHAARSIWLDSGDSFEGAPVFNVYKGEVEYRALSELGLDAAVIGNHEFDLGANNLYDKLVKYARFPVLAANYYFDDPSTPGKPKLREVVQPYQIFDLDGVKVGVIGMGNTDTLTSIYEGGNSLGFRPLDSNETVSSYVRLLRPAVDLVVILSHMGLDADEGLTADQVPDENTSLPLDGVDLILGGHLHIVLNPPKLAQVDKYGHPTVLVHSGAFAKYVGRLDLVVNVGTDNGDPAKRSYIKAFKYDNLPVSCKPDAQGVCQNPTDSDVDAMIQPYNLQLHSMLDLDGTFAYVNTSNKILRNDTSGGDSQLGNLVARSMQLTPGVNADFALTNSLGIRADFEYGALTLEDMYNVFPFENTIVVMFLSGTEIEETLNFVAARSSDRGCKSQVQVAGLWFTMICGADPHAEDIVIGEDCRRADGTVDKTRCQEVIPEGLYRVAVNDYIAAGGSGFEVLKRNTSKLNTGISLRAGLQNYIRTLKPCPMELKDPLPPKLPLVEEFGIISCLDDTVEPHDERILPLFR